MSRENVFYYLKINCLPLVKPFTQSVLANRTKEYCARLCVLQQPIESMEIWSVESDDYTHADLASMYVVIGGTHRIESSFPTSNDWTLFLEMIKGNANNFKFMPASCLANPEFIDQACSVNEAIHLTREQNEKLLSWRGEKGRKAFDLYHVRFNCVVKGMEVNHSRDILYRDINNVSHVDHSVDLSTLKWVQVYKIPTRYHAELVGPNCYTIPNLCDRLRCIPPPNSVDELSHVVIGNCLRQQPDTWQHMMHLKKTP